MDIEFTRKRNGDTKHAYMKVHAPRGLTSDQLRDLCAAMFNQDGKAYLRFLQSEVWIPTKAASHGDFGI
jgi:hypothetical protein